MCNLLQMTYVARGKSPWYPLTETATTNTYVGESTFRPASTTGVSGFNYWIPTNSGISNNFGNL